MTAIIHFPGVSKPGPVLLLFSHHHLGDPPVAAGHVFVCGHGHPFGRSDRLAGIRGSAAACLSVRRRRFRYAPAPLFVSGVMLFFVSAMFVSAYLASTINSRLRRREREVYELSVNLQRAYGRLQTLYDSAQAINSTLQLEEVLDSIVRRTADA